MADDLLIGSADYQALRRVPGIGPIIALTILAEGGDLRRFGHHRQFLKFCGLDLSTQQIGHIAGRRDYQSSAMPLAPNSMDRRTGRNPPAGERLPSQIRALYRQGSGQFGPQAQGTHRHYSQDGACRTRSSKAVPITGLSSKGGRAADAQNRPHAQSSDRNGRPHTQNEEEAMLLAQEQASAVFFVEDELAKGMSRPVPERYGKAFREAHV
jgi:hypothetical protein